MDVRPHTAIDGNGGGAVKKVNAFMRKSHIRAAAVAIALITLPPIGPAAAGGDTGVAEYGQKLAQRLCAKCHAVDLSGNSPFESAPPFRTFAQKYPLENLEEALAEGITVGHPAMPEFTFSPRQIDDFIAYLRTLN